MVQVLFHLFSFFRPRLHYLITQRKLVFRDNILILGENAITAEKENPQI